jgi:nitrogen fixation/metabolism regulation signal transduction histidine kinase
MVATSTGLAILLIIETGALFHYIKKIKRDVQRFIDAVKNQDTSLIFQKSSDDSFMEDLHDGFNEIITDFRLVRKEKQLEHHFFQNTIQHVPIGLIAFDDSGKVKLQNQAINDILNIKGLHNISNLKEIHPDLPDLLNSSGHGEESFLKALINNHISNLSIKASQVKLENKNYKIVSFQDISREIDKSEIEAWQKLIRVLRHEIMNSISPIRIMSGNLLNVTGNHREKIDNEILDDLINGLKTIRKRSQGLSEFLESYRSISKIPQPNFTEILIQSLFNETITLVDKNSHHNHVEINSEITPRDLKLLGDENLLQQVLINLIKNAMESLERKENPKISLIAKEKDNKTIIQIEDNGNGIPQDQLDNIFIPFYTTKEKGSGIGLNFSRQIMHLHNGTIHLSSKEGNGTTVMLEF